MPIEERLIDDLLVEYIYNPEGASRHPLLFVHGAWSGSWIFSNYLTYLASGGWNVYAMNLRGHYRSKPVDLSRVTLRNYMNDVTRIARRLPAPPVLIGYGTGAHILQHVLNTETPAAGAVFISTKLGNVAELIPVEVFKMPHLIPAERHGAAPDIQPETLDWLNSHRANCVEPRGVLVDLLSAKAHTQPHFVKVPYLVLNGEIDADISAEQGQQLANFYGGGGTLDIVLRASHTGILVGTEWREAANAINAWLGTNGFAEIKQSGSLRANDAE